MNFKLLFTFLVVCIFPKLYGQVTTKTYLFVGSYTDGKPSSGIYMYEFNSESGKLKEVSASKHLINPSFLTISPNGLFLYACTDTKLPDKGSVTAFEIDSLNGKLRFINKQPSGGENPVYLTVDEQTKFVINANYTAGNISVFTINENGSLNPYTQTIQFKGCSIITDRQEKAHIHSTVFSPKNDFIFFPDLGSDKIWVSKFDPTSPEPLIFRDDLTVKTVLGSGPRHFTFHPNGKFAYCIEELSGMITVYSYHNGKLDSIQRIFSYKKTQTTYGSADIHLSPDGLFIYASNRWDEENTISIFSVDSTNGKLVLVGHQSTYGDHPRNFTIDPTGKFLLVANQETDNIVVFKRNIKTGLLTKTKNEIKVASPSCLQMRTYSK